jgi:tetratricopeptide (TPR) repeat protein
MPNGIKLNSILKINMFIRDIGDGGAKSDKFERDIRLLTNGIKEDPNNVRYYFYLANTYCDNGDYEKAIETYKKRIKMGGWDQEVWYSYYRIGNCYKNMGKIEEAIFSWMNGYDYLPYRLENLYEIIYYYRIESKHKLCYMFYKLASDILEKNRNKNIDDYLFLHKDIYSYKIYYEYTIIASYVGIKNINDEIVTILNFSIDNSINNNLFSNIKFYKDILIPSHVVLMDSKKNITINNENIEFQSSSSCLIPNFDNTGYFLNVRYVNYYITPDGNYKNCDKHIITVNQLVKLDKKMHLISSEMFDCIFNDRRYIGIEDVRIFKDSDTNDKLLFTGTGFHENNQIGIVYGDYDIYKGLMLPNEITSSFSNSDCEKNWVYVTYENKTHMIYKWYPLQICKINENGKQIDLVKSIEMPRIFSHVRGSSCGFTYKNEIWFVVHNVSYESPRHYYHMIIVFDENMKLLRYSAPFKFEGEPIEYCLSIVVEDERVIINYSTWDRTSRIGIYDKKYIDSITKYN